MKRFLIFLAIFMLSGHADTVRNCEDEYLEGVGWKKIVYTENGPIESLGRCKQEEDISNIIITGLLIWGLYEIYDVDEPDQMSLYQNNNLTLFPLSEIHIRNEEATQLEVTVFRFRF